MIALVGFSVAIETPFSECLYGVLKSLNPFDAGVGEPQVPLTQEEEENLMATKAKPGSSQPWWTR
jgi:hypothetical protein